MHQAVERRVRIRAAIAARCGERLVAVGIDAGSRLHPRGRVGCWMAAFIANILALSATWGGTCGEGSSLRL